MESFFSKILSVQEAFQILCYNFDTFLNLFQMSILLWNQESWALARSIGVVGPTSLFK